MSSCGPAGAGELNGGMDTCRRRFTLSLSYHCVSHVTVTVSQAHLRQPPWSFCAVGWAFCVVLLAYFVVTLLILVNFEIGPAPLATKNFSYNYHIFVHGTNECCLAIGRIREAFFVNRSQHFETIQRPGPYPSLFVDVGPRPYQCRRDERGRRSLTVRISMADCLLLDC